MRVWNYNARQRGDGWRMLATLPKKSTPLVIFDPQYRGVLDHLQYGNEGARQIGRAKLPQMSDEHITGFITEIDRILKPSGHLMLWLDKFTVVEARWREWLAHSTHLIPVDLITWDKGRIGMGRRSRYRTETLIVLQRGPTRAKGCWRDHSIGDNWLEYADHSAHPHAKPLQLTQRLICSTTKRGDLVVDPAAGGYGVLAACQATGRKFLGCDLL